MHKNINVLLVNVNECIKMIRLIRLYFSTYLKYYSILEETTWKPKPWFTLEKAVLWLSFFKLLVSTSKI